MGLPPCVDAFALFFPLVTFQWVSLTFIMVRGAVFLDMKLESQEDTAPSFTITHAGPAVFVVTRGEYGQYMERRGRRGWGGHPEDASWQLEETIGWDAGDMSGIQAPVDPQLSPTCQRPGI